MTSVVNISVPREAPPWVTILVRNIEQAIMSAVRAPISNSSKVVTLTLAPTATAMITTSVALVDGAAAQGGTLLNAPVAGNPTKWVAISDNGTQRFIPTW